MATNDAKASGVDGSESKSARAGREPVTKERIFSAALALIDSEGVEALTMRRLAKDLGVEAMALYHHVPNKEAIYDGVVELAVVNAGHMEITEDWMTNLVNGAELFRYAIGEHPRVMPLITNRTLKASPLLGMIEGPLAMLTQGGFEGQALIDAYHAYLAYLFGWSLLAVGIEAAKAAGDLGSPVAPEIEEQIPLTRAVGPAVNDWSHGFAEGLRTLLRALAEENAKPQA